MELKYLRNEKIVENEAVAKYRITPVDTRCVGTDKAFEEEPIQIRSRFVAREIESYDRPDFQSKQKSSVAGRQRASKRCGIVEVKGSCVNMIPDTLMCM